MGRDKTFNKIAERFYWKMMWKDVEEYVLSIEMELGDLEMSSSVSRDQETIDEHCAKMAAIKKKVVDSAADNIKCAQIRYKKDYDRKHAR